MAKKNLLRRLRNTALLTLALGAPTLTASAAVIVSYSYASDLNATSQVAEVLSTSTASSLANGYVGNDGFGNVFEAYSGAATTASAAISGGNYFAVDVVLTPGSTMNLASLAFAVGAGDNINNGTRGYVVRSSVDSFASDLFSETFASGTGYASPTARSINLSGAAFQGLSSIDFRFYVFNPAAFQSTDFRNLALDGTINAASVPEPTILLTFGTGLALLMWKRRVHS